MRIASPGVCLVAFLIVIVSLRVIAIGQYPAVHSDEGFWAGGAQDYALYGNGLMSGRLHPFLCPGHFVPLAGFFFLVRPSLVTARLFGAFAGVLTCLLIVLIARRYFPHRWWLFPFLFSVSSLVVNIHRMALLEADQMFWLVLAASFWLYHGRFTTIGAGAALGVALLVKSNSIYLLPAFLCSPPNMLKEAIPRSFTSRSMHVLVFILTCGVVAGAGYFTAWKINSDAFTAAFQYELDGKHFLDGGELFHLGRFGLHPPRAIASLKVFVLGDPLLLVLAVLGLMLILRNRTEASRADRFFSIWAVCGFVFIFGQILVADRYLTTILPAVAYLATRFLDWFFAWVETKSSARRSRLAILGLVLLFCGFHVIHLAAGIIRQPNSSYWAAISWVEENIPHEANVLAAPHLGLSLPQRNYEFYRAIFSYDGTTQPIETVVGRHNISVIVVDAECREYQTLNMTKFLAEHCTRLIAQNDQTGQGTEIYLVRKGGW